MQTTPRCASRSKRGRLQKRRSRLQGELAEQRRTLEHVHERLGSLLGKLSAPDGTSSEPARQAQAESANRQKMPRELARANEAKPLEAAKANSRAGEESAPDPKLAPVDKCQRAYDADVEEDWEMNICQRLASRWGGLIRSREGLNSRGERWIGRAAAATALAFCSACAGGDDETILRESAGSETVVKHSSAIERGWELAPNQVTISDEWAGDKAFSYTDEERARMAEALGDASPWIAADGERYEALFVLPDGTTFGRRGPAPVAPEPDEATDTGAFAGTDIDTELGQAEQKLTIGTNSTNDRRARITANLNTFPQRTNGAMSSNGNTQSGGCSGTRSVHARC